MDVFFWTQYIKGHLQNSGYYPQQGYAMRFVCHSVCLSFCVCEQDYYKSNEPISLKLGVMIGPTNRENRFTFSGNHWVPDTDSRSLFHFPHRCRIGNFRRFISFSHTVTGRFSQHSAKWLTPTRWWIRNILAAIRQTFRFESRITPLRLDALAEVCALWVQSSLFLRRKPIKMNNI